MHKGCIKYFFVRNNRWWIGAWQQVSIIFIEFFLINSLFLSNLYLIDKYSNLSSWY